MESADAVDMHMGMIWGFSDIATCDDCNNGVGVAVWPTGADAPRSIKALIPVEGL